MTPERSEQLLGLAVALAGELESQPIPYHDSSSPELREEIASKGVSPSCLSHAAAYLTAEPDLTRFRQFVGLLDQLDPIAGQNQLNPKAEHAVLRARLESFLDREAGLEVGEVLFVLKWAQRLLPKPEPERRPGNRHSTPHGQPARPQRPPQKYSTGDEKLSALAAAFQQAAPKGPEEKPKALRRGKKIKVEVTAVEDGEYVLRVKSTGQEGLRFRPPARWEVGRTYTIKVVKVDNQGNVTKLKI